MQLQINMALYPYGYNAYAAVFYVADFFKR